MCEICSKLVLKARERRQRRFSGNFIVNFEQDLHIVLVFLLLTFTWQKSWQLTSIVVNLLMKMFERIQENEWKK